MAAHPAAIPGSSGILTCQLEAGEVIVPTALLGWSVQESSGSAAVKIELYDGTSTSGTPLAQIEVPSGLEKTYEFPAPIEVDSGSIYVSITGACTGEVYWA